MVCGKGEFLGTNVKFEGFSCAILRGKSEVLDLTGKFFNTLTCYIGEYKFLGFIEVFDFILKFLFAKGKMSFLSATFNLKIKVPEQELS